MATVLDRLVSRIQKWLDCVSSPVLCPDCRYELGTNMHCAGLCSDVLAGRWRDENHA